MAISKEGINIGTISGGIVNFGGAVYIAPISVTNTVAGSGEDNTSTTTKTHSPQSAVNLANNLLNTIRRSR